MRTCVWLLTLISVTLSGCCCNISPRTPDAGAPRDSGSGGGNGVGGGSGGGPTGGGNGGGSGGGGGGGVTPGFDGGGGGGGGSTSDGGPRFDAGNGFDASVGPVATVTSTAPTAGEYGTMITIQGSNFGPSGSVRLASGIGVITLNSSALKADAGEHWQDTRIAFRYPFPAEGNIVVSTSAGLADAGLFAPSWLPGVPLNQAQDVYTPFPSTMRVAPGTVATTLRYPDQAGVFSYGGWGIMIHDSAAPRVFKLQSPPGYASVLSVHLAPGSGSMPAGVALVSDQETPDAGTDAGAYYTYSVMNVAWHSGMPDLEPTGFTARAALGAGTDTTGLFAWALGTDGGLSRLRPGTPSWTVDKTLAPPTGFKGRIMQTFFSGDTLVALWTIGRSTGFPFYKYYEHPELAFANPSQTSWVSTTRSAGEIDGYLNGVNPFTSSDGTLSIVYSGGYSTSLLEAVHSWKSELRAPSGDFAVAPRLDGGSPFILASPSGAACGEGGLRVVSNVPSTELVSENAGEVAIWPCTAQPWQVVLDVDGRAMVLFEHAGRIYLVKKR